MSFQVLSREGVAGTEAPFAEVHAVLLRQDLVAALRPETVVEAGNLSVQTSTPQKGTGPRYGDRG